MNPITAKRNTLTAFSPSPWATGVFRESTECAFGPTKVSESPFAKVARAGVRLWGEAFGLFVKRMSIDCSEILLSCTDFG